MGKFIQEVKIKNINNKQISKIVNIVKYEIKIITKFNEYFTIKKYIYLR